MNNQNIKRGDKVRLNDDIMEVLEVLHPITAVGIVLYCLDGYSKLMSEDDIKPIKFKVGDKAILNRGVCFVQVSGDYELVGAGAMVEIVSVSDSADATEKTYKICHQYSTATVLGQYLDKIEFKFNIGDRVTLVDRPLAVFTIVDQIIKDGKLYYDVEGRPNYLPYEESELMPYGNKIVKHKFNVNDKVRLTDVPDSLTYTIKGISFQDGGYIYTLDNGTTKICVAENLIELISEGVTGSKVEYKFNVGDIAVLKQDTPFEQGSAACLISAGAKVEIVSVSDYINNTDKLYGVKHHNGTSVVRGCDLIPIEPTPIKYKFKVGDKVKADDNQIYTVIGQFVECGEPTYRLKSTLGETSCAEIWLELVPQDITERIKTLEDAVKWCNENNYDVYTSAYNVCVEDMGNDDRVKDIIAYLKLRIITAALNEGWEPTREQPEELWSVVYDWRFNQYSAVWYKTQPPISQKLALKSKELAQYAAKQFADIYADFYGCKEGGEK